MSRVKWVFAPLPGVEGYGAGFEKRGRARVAAECAAQTLPANPLPLGGGVESAATGSNWLTEGAR